MKPNFALKLTDDSISLLTRTARGWLEVGSTTFDAPDLGEALSYLRRSALGLAPHGISTKLVIPNSQILYTEVVAPGPDASQRRGQIRRALEGLTPYPVDELVFDWRGNGPTVQVAVVAKETLAEAEAFANQHRFSPISFVAIPDPAKFGAEPWFGVTEMAAELVPAGEKVDRDQDAIVVVTRDGKPAESSHGAAGKPAAAKADAPVAAPPVADDLPPPEPYRRPSPPEPVVTAAKVSGDPAPEAPALTGSKAARQKARRQASAEAAMGADRAKAAPQPVVASNTPPIPAAEVSKLPEAVVADPEAEAKPAASPDVPAIAPTDAAPDDTTLAGDPALPPRDDIALPPRALPQIEAATPSSFATRRGPEGNAAAPTSGSAAAGWTAPPLTSSRPDPLRNPVAERGVDRGPAPTMSPAMAPDRRPLPESQSGGLSVPPPRPRVEPFTPSADLAPSPQNNARDLTAPDTSGSDQAASEKVETADQPDADQSGWAIPPSLPPAVAALVAQKKARGLSAPVTAPGISGLDPRRPKPASSRPQMSDDAAQSAKPPFARRGAPQRGKPRFLGLILTVLLLVFLAVAAAWSSFYLASSDDPATEPALATATPETPPADEVAAAADVLDPAVPTPGPDDPVATDVPEPTDLAATDSSADPAADPAADLAATEPLPEETLPAAPAPASPDTADTVLPGAGSSQDEIFLATMDAAPPDVDALALPQPDPTADVLPLPQMPPPPFGATYAFDADGLVQPTAEGVITPEGVHLVLGKPSRVPPPRPAALAAAEAEAAAVVTPPAPETPALPGAAAAITAPDATAPLVDLAQPAAPADPALAEARPRTRPADLAPPPVVTPPDDGASLAIPAGSRLTSLRPRARPETVLAMGEAARLATQAASLSASAATATEPQAEPAGARIALNGVGVSRRPAARPGDFSKAVEAAVAAAVRAPEQQQASAAPSEPEAQDEPEATSAPQIPTRASVAKQATFVNAISLSETNLIGIYGAANNRHALIRQGNGRFKKIKVGDRVDGGTVAAITATEVRYQKGGRMLALALPRG